MLLSWWKAVNWIEWFDDIGCVERPTEDRAIKRLAIRSNRAALQLAAVRELLFRDVVREVLAEERAKRQELTLREIHHQRGVELQWVNTALPGKEPDYVVVEVSIDLTKTA